MEISESIYEVILEPSYKKTTRSDSKCDGPSRKMRGEAALSTTCSNISESADKCRKSYIDHKKDKSELTCIIHGLGYSSD